MKKGSVTIKDIARELEISVSTVSRALADNPLVKISTRKAVKDLAERYNYTPNFTALSLRSNKTKTVGIIIPQLVHEFFALVIRGIEDYAYDKGYNVLISSTNESYEREVIDARALINGRVDGVLACVSKNTDDFSHFMEFHEREVPIVFFDCICEDMDSPKVVLDDYKAGHRATQHLIEQGSTRLAYVGGPINLPVYKDRFEGYKAALRENGISLNEDWVIHCITGDYEEGKKSTHDLILKQEIDGLFAGTDMLAIGAMKNIKATGLKIPEDIAVVGFSNWSISSLYEPSLSTMSQPGYEMGQKAAQIVIDQINGVDIRPETIVLHSELIVRESSQRKK